MSTVREASKTHKYIPRIPQRQENLFLEEYYSGTDTKVYINDKEQTEISYITFSLNEQLKPIYGYASRTFDDMAVGSRIVTGILKMPIKNPEDQDSREVVIEQPLSTVEEMENMNKEELDKINKTEWITNTSSDSTGYTNDNIFEYQNKLIYLGYTPSNSGKLDAQTRKAIIQFQLDNEEKQTGQFDNDTMAIIDSKIESSNAPVGTTNSETKIYVGLSTASGVIGTLKMGEKFYIIKNLGVFTLIRTMDDKDGYIETSRIEVN